MSLLVEAWLLSGTVEWSDATGMGWATVLTAEGEVEDEVSVGEAEPLTSHEASRAPRADGPGLVGRIRSRMLLAALLPTFALVVMGAIGLFLLAQRAADDPGADLGSLALTLSLLLVTVAVIVLLILYVVARTTAERLTAPLGLLQTEAGKLADHDLPELVRAMETSTDSNDLPAVEPIDIDADGEVAQLAHTFNTIRSTAMGLAAGQAVERSRDVARVLLNLGRRNQQLIGRQLKFIDQLERTESNPETLRSLFQLDQMATRMRRNAESLLVLAGEETPRRGTRPRLVLEIIRAATSEVEDYARVQALDVEPVNVHPWVASDLTHMLAELIENAASFSAPTTTVDIVGTSGPNGAYTISIIDHGVGMSSEKLADANRRLSEPTFGQDAADSFLGLYVVGRLAARHRIDTRLVESATVGTTAKITLPPACLADKPELDEAPSAEQTSAEQTAVAPVDDDSDPAWPPPPADGLRGTAPRPALTSSSLASRAGDDDTPARSATVEPAAPTADPIAGRKADADTDVPIPPYKERQSRRGDSPDPASERFQVRRRARRKTPRSAGNELTPAAKASPDGAKPEPEARAAEVRDKLSNFVSGVEAGKQESAGRTNGNGDSDPHHTEESGPGDTAHTNGVAAGHENED